MISVRSLFLYILYVVLFLAVMAATGFITAMLIVKSGKEIEVPNITGMELVDALETLSRAGLSLKVGGFEFSASIPRNAVLRQEPGSGSRLKTGTAIQIVLSRGTEKIRAPDLVGMTRRQAEIVISKNGLAMGHISETHSMTTEPGRILAQQPEPSRSVSRGSAINLLVSLGPRPARYMMPDLLGRPQEQAMMALEKMRLKAGEIRSRHQPNARPGQVLEQLPRPGHAVAEGDVVSLVIQPDGSQGRDASRLALVQYALPPGFLRSRVEVKIQRNRSVVSIFSQFTDPGELVAVLVLVDNETRVIFTVDGREVNGPQFKLQEFKDAS